MTESGAAATVLVVEDEKPLADLYSLHLREQYDVRTAYSGHEALELIDDDVDVVLLDRRMPELSGDEVLDAIREEGYDCRVIVVTAVAPDFDILSMPFDDYLCKPIGREDLLAAIGQQLTIREYDRQLTDLFATVSKRTAIESTKPQEVLDANQEYRDLVEREAELREELDRLSTEIDDLLVAFAAIDRTS